MGYDSYRASLIFYYMEKMIKSTKAEELSASLKGLMASFCWQMDKRMSGYSVGMLAGTPEYECLELATEMVEKDYDGVIGAIEMAVEREYLRKLADLRIQQGEEQTINGVKSVFWGVLAIYLPGGFGIPLMTAMRVNGVVSTAYGIFEWDEGIQKQELGNIGDVTADTFNFGSDVICLGYDGVYHTIGEVSVFISKLEVSNVLWGYAARAFNSVTGTIKGLTKRIVWRKNVVGGANGSTIPRGNLTGTLDGLTAAERAVVDDLLKAGNNVEIIPRSNVPNNRTPDFLVNGIKTELKTLTGTSLNTPVTRIQDGFKQGAEVVIIDGRNTGLTLEQANIIIERALGKYGSEFPGIVEVWTVEGIIRR